MKFISFLSHFQMQNIKYRICKATKNKNREREREREKCQTMRTTQRRRRAAGTTRVAAPNRVGGMLQSAFGAAPGQ